MRSVAIACAGLILASFVAGLPVIGNQAQRGAALEQPPAKSKLGSEHFNCEICDWVVTQIFQFVSSSNYTSCSTILPHVDHICNDVPFNPIGPAFCRWLVAKECPTVLHFLSEGKTANETCEAIGLCAGADSKCHSFGKLQDNGRCTAILANDTDYWRLEWNILPWWKNKGCNPPRHIGLHEEWCTTANIGCCLSGWTQH